MLSPDRGISGNIEKDKCHLCACKGSQEKEMATHSSILAWKIPWTEATVLGVTKSQTRLSDLTVSLSML